MELKWESPSAWDSDDELPHALYSVAGAMRVLRSGFRVESFRTSFFILGERTSFARDYSPLLCMARPVSNRFLEDIVLCFLKEYEFPGD